ncbi:MAG: hypothetical protein ACYS21_04450, partial [Planctomycetota bacterium]
VPTAHREYSQATKYKTDFALDHSFQNELSTHFMTTVVPDSIPYPEPKYSHNGWTKKRGHTTGLE